MNVGSALDDPFPEIKPALLNSADIYLYATYGEPRSRLFQPFDSERLKPASYEILFEGARCYSWSKEDSRLTEQVLSTSTQLRIPSNTIVFVCPEVKFVIPPYLALRFNFAIRWVHRGLLLGTGPLVDPGFQGKLLIPVHNLTDEDVIVNATDGFIWIEVTKTSPIPPLVDRRAAFYVPFNPDKKDVSVAEYFFRANKGNPIRSSITSIQNRVEEFTKKQELDSKRYEREVKQEVERLERRVSLLSAAGLIGGGITIVAIVISLYQLSEATKALVLTSVQTSSDSYGKINERLSAMETKRRAVPAQTNSTKEPNK